MGTPFTYLIYSKRTNQYYYGVRYCNGCHPNQLWTTYFTSSKVIKSLIKMYGTDEFIVSIRKTFANAETAINWESRFLNRVKAATSNKWLNLHNGDGNFRNKGGYKLSKETKEKMSKPKSEQTKEKMSKAKTGSKNKVLGKQRIGSGNPRAIPITIFGVTYSCKKEAQQSLQLTSHFFKKLIKEIL